MYPSPPLERRSEGRGAPAEPRRAADPGSAGASPSHVSTCQRAPAPLARRCRDATLVSPRGLVLARFTDCLAGDCAGPYRARNCNRWGAPTLEQLLKTSLPGRARRGATHWCTRNSITAPRRSHKARNNTRKTANSQKWGSVAKGVHKYT